jgi:hypothetical protein
MPALFTTASMRPKLSIAACTMACAPAQSATLWPSATALLCRRRIGGGVTPDRAAQIVDDHGCSGPRHIERYPAADSPASSGDEGDLAFHAAGHDELLSFRLL